MKKQKRTLKFGASLLLLLLIVLGLFLFKWLLKPNNETKNGEKYIASSSLTVSLYDTEFNKVEEISRGTKIKKVKDNIKSEEGIKYVKIILNNKEYLVLEENLVKSEEQIVLETEMYVRTPVTVYKNNDTSEILSMLKKGTKVEVLGFDKVDNEGVVNKYQIKSADIEGFVYGKYLVFNYEEAILNYEEEGSYKIHSKRGNTLGGGSAANLDFYPYKKAKFENNVMPDEVRSLYLNTVAIRNVDEYIKLAKESNINAFVVDIKDNTTPGYKSEVMKKYSPKNYERAHNSFENYKRYVKKLIDEGFYVIGRITVFKDSYYIDDNPESAILDNNTKKPFLHNSSYWPSAFRRDVWEFNVELAKEAVIEMGFHEIQFDYVRFPDRTKSLEDADKIDMRNAYNEDKAAAIQMFLMYACDEIHQVGAYVSADVFGEAAHTYVTGYGQYWGAISNVVDVISGMPYPDHFNAYQYGFDEIVWTVPGKLLKHWGENYVNKRQSEIPTPAIVRTWIQAYNAIRKPFIEYDADKISEQIQGLYDAGLKGGYMTWNSASSLNKYKDISSAFTKEY